MQKKMSLDNFIFEDRDAKNKFIAHCYFYLYPIAVRKCYKILPLIIYIYNMMRLLYNIV